MEKTPTTTISRLLVWFYKILYWNNMVCNFFSNSLLLFQPLLNFASTKWKLWSKNKSLNTKPLNQFPLLDKQCNRVIDKGDVKVIMERLGIAYDPEKENMEEIVYEDELEFLLEEETSLEEVKAAFEVFDGNKDGFIDAADLQRVLWCLGFEEGSEIEQCRRMVGAFDENSDGLIDFDEFVKLV